MTGWFQSQYSQWTIFSYPCYLYVDCYMNNDNITFLIMIILNHCSNAVPTYLPNLTFISGDITFFYLCIFQGLVSYNGWQKVFQRFFFTLIFFRQRYGRDDIRRVEWEWRWYRWRWWANVWRIQVGSDQENNLKNKNWPDYNVWNWSKLSLICNEGRKSRNIFYRFI